MLQYIQPKNAQNRDFHVKNELSYAKNYIFSGFRKIFGGIFSESIYGRGNVMKKKSYRGSRCEKRSMSKCADGVARTYNAIESNYAQKLEDDPEVKEFRCQVPLEGLEIGEYCSDFVAVKVDGDLKVRECVYRKHLVKPMTAKLLDVSRNYWMRRGVTDWGIVVEKKEDADGEKPAD